MKRSEAFWILNEMYELANEAQKQALDIAQRDIEFVDLMPDVPVQRWIPVTERLPKDSEHILVCYRDGWVCDQYSPVDGGVTHWMTLPEPPKESAE